MKCSARIVALGLSAFLAACTDPSALPTPAKVTGAQGGTIERTLWIFGGENELGRKKEVWSVDFDDLSWIQHPDMPTARVGGRAIYDGTSAFLLVGGCVTPAAGEDACAPVIRFDIETQTWTPLAEGPGNRLSPGLAMEAETLWLFGGVDPESGATLTDVWSYLGGWTSLGDPRTINGFDHVISGATLAANDTRITTLSAGLLTTWESGSPQTVAQIGVATMQPDCMWASDYVTYVWSDSDVYACSDGTAHCEQDAVYLRMPVPGTVCGPVDATLWTFGGGGSGDTGEAVDLNNELWRYHSTEWVKMMDGGDATSGGE